MKVGPSFVIPTSVLVLVLLSNLGPPEAADVKRGKATYEELCAKCHGSEGKGDGREAATLTTKPKDLADCPRMVAFSDDQLFEIIKEGGAETKLSKDMPPYGDALEDDEIRDTVAFIRSLCRR